MAKQPQNAISPTRAEDYPEWYQQVIKAGDLAEVSDVRGCMVIKPWGYAIWENIQRVLDTQFKETGHQNAYFPLFIPLSFLEKEAEHVEGFAKECAVVTHHRLIPDGKGGLMPDPEAKLTEPLVVRPTSEMIIGATFARWVQSYRDLPILLNQWANVVRWEMRTRMFLRTAEFLWQEGHTVHATSEDAMRETRLILKLYAEFAEQYLAMPVIVGEKTAGERFPGAVSTFAIEAMMQDRKALQAGTSHFLGQNFAKAQQIKFQNEAGSETFCWTTSWGVSTRLIGGLIMTHADDDGMVVPPRIAPKHVVILPIYRTDEEKAAVLEYCSTLAADLKAVTYHEGRVQVEVDDRDLRGGEKVWQHIKRGVPIRLEIGPRDMAAGSVFCGRRDRGTKEKQSLPRDEFVSGVVAMLDDIQQTLYDRALAFRKEHTREIDSLDEFRAYFTPENEEKQEIHGGFAVCSFVDEPAVAEILKDLKVTIRCVPLDQDGSPGVCIFTGKPTTTKAIFAKSY
jgi:prolyl-tRNA synthetase